MLCNIKASSPHYAFDSCSGFLRYKVNCLLSKHFVPSGALMLLMSDGVQLSQMKLILYAERVAHINHELIKVYASLFSNKIQTL